MKKTIALMLVATMLFSLTACGTDSTLESSSVQDSSLQTPETTIPSQTPTPKPTPEATSTPTSTPTPTPAPRLEPGDIYNGSEFQVSVSELSDNYKATYLEQAPLNDTPCESLDLLLEESLYHVVVDGVDTGTTIAFYSEGAPAINDDSFDQIIIKAKGLSGWQFPSSIMLMTFLSDMQTLDACDSFFTPFTVALASGNVGNASQNGISYQFELVGEDDNESVQITMSTLNSYNTDDIVSTVNLLDMSDISIYDGTNFTANVSEFLTAYSKVYVEESALTDEVKCNSLTFQPEDKLFRLLTDGSDGGATIGFTRNGEPVTEGEFDQIIISADSKTFAFPFAALASTIRTDFSIVHTRIDLLKELSTQISWFQDLHSQIANINDTAISTENGITYRYGGVDLGIGTMIMLTISTAATPTQN